MAEWSNAAVLKTVVRQRTGGSNPSLSARKSSFKNETAFFMQLFFWSIMRAMFEDLGNVVIFVFSQKILEEGLSFEYLLIKMTDFTKKHCEPCRGGIPPLTKEEIKERMAQLEEWEVKDDHHLIRSFAFPNFKLALDFINKVGQIAEQEGHHPEFCFTWGKVTISIWTHKIDGLHDNDFILAAKINSII